MKEQRHKDGKKECMVCRNFIWMKTAFDICEICGWKNDELTREALQPSGVPNRQKDALSNNNT